jgi:hypothetical protein
MTADISHEIVSGKYGEITTRARQADVPDHAESDAKTRQPSGQDTVRQTALWRIDFSIDRELSSTIVGQNNGGPSETPLSPAPVP